MGGGGAERGLGDGLVVAVGVGVRHAGGFVVGADQARHVAGRVHLWAAEHPDRGGEVGGVGPLALRQGAVDHAAGDGLDLVIGEHGGAPVEGLGGADSKNPAEAGSADGAVEGGTGQAPRSGQARADTAMGRGCWVCAWLSFVRFTAGLVAAPRHAAKGWEYQMIDDARNVDNAIASHLSGSLYDLFPPTDRQRVKPAGEWNRSRIVFRGSHGEHWMNGAKIVEFQTGTSAFDSAFAKSKYRSYPVWFPERRAGHIVLQDHNDAAWFRNLKIRTLN